MSVFFFLGFFLNFPLGKNLVYVHLKTFALMEGEKMKSEIVLTSNELRDEIFTELCLHIILALGFGITDEYYLTFRTD